MPPLPTYPKQGCPMCRPQAPGTCDRCGGSLSEIPDPAVRGQGYEAHSYDHQHFGETGQEAAVQKLCLECYRKDFAAVYPDHPLPV